MSTDSKYMCLALQQAHFAIGVSRPNPPVGAVVVSNGIVVGKGFTQAPGNAHAEVMAIKDAGPKALGADLWVTLEPCCHYGRTPPCTQAIGEAGIRRVFYSHPDPNPAVRSKSKEILEAVGIEVFEGILSEETNRFYEAYDYFVRNQRPFVEVKVAQTQDGFIAGKNRERLMITGDEANHWTNSLRSISDAILIGGGTLEADDPLLSLRGLEGNSPERIVLVGKRLLSSRYRMFHEGKKPIIYSEVPQKEIEEIAEVRLLRGNNFLSHWTQIIDDLSNRGMHRLLVEAGSQLSKLIIDAQVYNRFHVWVSPKRIGEGLPWALTIEMDPSEKDQHISFVNHKFNGK
jgi:diaminohydroxyphosphoribosylaminopyrimidine deaminase/5-amino-6-(5-phosphoribosylamino)uracil reductase